MCMIVYSAHGKLTIRLLLDINETCLRSQGFFDLWKQQKKYENDIAITRFRARLAEIDSLHDMRQRWTELCRGVLAGIDDKLKLFYMIIMILYYMVFFLGNMFDWGAQAVTAILEQDAVFGLHEALQKIQKRPWLYDGLDKWLDKLEVLVLLMINHIII